MGTLFPTVHMPYSLKSFIVMGQIMVKQQCQETEFAKCFSS